jgi:hypothetical protein
MRSAFYLLFLLALLTTTAQEEDSGMRIHPSLLQLADLALWWLAWLKIRRHAIEAVSTWAVKAPKKNSACVAGLSPAGPAAVPRAGPHSWRCFR